MLRRFVLWVLAWYRQYRGLRPDACRFDPTCSTYAAEAVDLHGPIKGLYLAGRRVLRCHPLGGRGYDPVPLKTVPPKAMTASKRLPASAELRPEHHHA